MSPRPTIASCSSNWANNCFAITTPLHAGKNWNIHMGHTIDPPSALQRHFEHRLRKNFELMSRAEWERTRTENGNLQLQLRISLGKLNHFKAQARHPRWEMRMAKDFWRLALLTSHRMTFIFPWDLSNLFQPTPSGHLDRAVVNSSLDAYIQ